MEVWKVIPGYEDYQVSDQGNVRSLKYNNTKQIKNLSPVLNKFGYYQVTLRGKILAVHQLVAMAFLGHKPVGMNFVVDHINEIKTDNRIKNLQVISNQQNIIKSIKRDLPLGVHFCNTHKKFKAQIRINGKQKGLGYFRTLEEASAAYQKALLEIK
jgi:hypothetical protein